MKSKAVNVFWITKYRLNVMQHLLFDIDQYKFVFMSTFSNHHNFFGSDLAIFIFSVKHGDAYALMLHCKL